MIGEASHAIFEDGADRRRLGAGLFHGPLKAAIRQLEDRLHKPLPMVTWQHVGHLVSDIDDDGVTHVFGHLLTLHVLGQR